MNPILQKKFKKLVNTQKQRTQNQFSGKNFLLKQTDEQTTNLIHPVIQKFQGILKTQKPKATF